MSGKKHPATFSKKVQKHFKKRFGSTLQHGDAHVKEHAQWNRRAFLKMTGLTALGSALMLGGMPVGSAMPNALFSALASSECDDRILVLIRLKGGNDGLNTVILRGNDEYYNLRPAIGVQEPGLWALNDDYGMPNALLDLQPFWEEGKMQIIHNVGYPDANYSHFRSSDIWASASDATNYVGTGWIGRWLDHYFPAFQTAPPVVPPALQIGVESNLIFRSAVGNMALNISNPKEFYEIAQSGELYDTSQLNAVVPNEAELAYVRGVANSAFRYADSIKEAYNAATNQVSYQNNYLAEQLAIVARLIKGNLGTKVYMVALDGFDTHASQNPGHFELLNMLGNSIRTFFDDLASTGHSQNVLAMTFSEFGRSIFENGSLGTDHGTGAPMLLIGEGIGSGTHGTPPDLLSVDPYGDPPFSTDFRQAYATVLQNWMCMPQEVVDFVIGNQHFQTIDTLLPESSFPLNGAAPAVLLGHNPTPNQPGIIQIKYAIRLKGIVRLQILDRAGQHLRTLVNEFKERGSYVFNFNPADFFLPPGEYLYKLDSGGRSFSRPMKF